MVSVIASALNIFVQQNNLIVKTGKDLLMSGELDLDNLDGVGVAIECIILKKKRNLEQNMEGNVTSFPAYVMAKSDVTPTIETHDLLITGGGEKFIVGPVSLRHDLTLIAGISSDAEYTYAELELWEDS